jgi:hypothetical protein
MDPSYGPVQRAIRLRFPRVPVKLATYGRGVTFELDYDADGITLRLGEGRWPSDLPWECLASIPSFLQSPRGWVVAGGKHSVFGEPGTLDEYLKRWQKTDVARWLAKVLADAGVVDVDDGRPLKLRARST